MRQNSRSRRLICHRPLVLQFHAATRRYALGGLEAYKPPRAFEVAVTNVVHSQYIQCQSPRYRCMLHCQSPSTTQYGISPMPYPYRANPSDVVPAGEHCNVTSDLSICSVDFSIAFSRQRFTSSSTTPQKLSSPSCMDLDQHVRSSSSRHLLRPTKSSTCLQTPATTQGHGSYSYNSPLPQSQWATVPLEYQPLGLADRYDQLPSERTAIPQADTNFSWRLRPQPPEQFQPHAKTAPKSKRRRLQQGLQDLVGRNNDGLEQRQVDPSLLYPQMSPYDDLQSSYSAPDEMQHIPRSVSQPNSPDFFRLHDEQGEPHAMQLPRSPTFPPTRRRRFHSTSRAHDPAFAGEEDFHLFVQATAGLSLDHEQTLRPSSQRTVAISHEQQERHFENTDLRLTTSSTELVSPLEETPTTMRALQALAQMPQASEAMSRRRLQTSPSGLDLWLSPPSATSATQSASSFPSPQPAQLRGSASPTPRAIINPMQEYLNDFVSDEASEHTDDELPDYASSQAQAQASQRVEAARRAQELQRRWREGGGRQGV